LTCVAPRDQEDAALDIALIPARGGSKRIPGKNVKLFRGKPMLAWSVEAAQASGLFDRIVVSTDSEEIAAVARAHGAEVPFLRPADISDDFTPLASVIKHALAWLQADGADVERICTILATAPFVRPADLVAGRQALVEADVASVFAVTSFAFPILRALRITDDGSLAMVWPEHELTRSNDLPEMYHDAGQFYWLDAARFLTAGRAYTQDARPVVLPRYIVQDIDTPEDWIRAELMHRVQEDAGGAP
jgi:pseudaminic acid cytidylyltransferase